MRRSVVACLAVLPLFLDTTLVHGALVLERDGPVFVVNDLRYRSQTQPDVAVISPHESLVVWVGPHVEGTKGGGIWARFVHDTGPVGEEFLLDPAHTSFPTFEPRVAHGANGSSAVIYQAEAGNKGDQGGVFLRTLDSNGAATDAGETQVHDDAGGYQQPGNVVAEDDGTFLVAWYDEVDVVSDVTIVVRRFDGNGKAMTGEIPLASGQIYPLRQTLPVAALPGGRAVAAWSTLGSVQASWIEADGAVSAPRVLASGIPAAQPSVLACDDGRHLVVWSSPGGSGGTDLLGQWLDSDGENAGVVQLLLHDSYPWSGYDTPNATMMPGCTALLELRALAVLARPDGAVSAGYTSDGDASLDAESSRRFARVSTIADVLYNVDVQAQWYCVMRDDDAICGDATCVGDADLAGSERVNLRDALRVLRAAVGLESCSLCRCDADASGATTVGDAARILKFSVGVNVPLSCPVCVAEQP